MTAQTYTLETLAKELNAHVLGEPGVEISGVATLMAAESHELSFLANPKYARYLPKTRAGVVLVTAENAALCPVPALVVADPYLAYAQVSHWFAQRPQALGIHPTAQVDHSATVSEDATIGPYAVVEADCVLAPGVVVGAQCVVMAGCQLGANTRLWPQVSLYPGVCLGESVVIHSGTVVGSDGFGYAPRVANPGQAAHQSWQKIAQLGGVRIGDRVEIGACCSIDCGALGDTVIARDVIIDNQVQIAHNVTVGVGTAIAGCVGIAGSTDIGANCTLGGAAKIAGHLKICDGVHVGMQAQVTCSIHQSGAYASGTGLMAAPVWRKNVARLRHLDQWIRETMHKKTKD